MQDAKVSNSRQCASCDEDFPVDKLTIHCIKCDRWYCPETSCWVDFNDESWPTDNDNVQRRFWKCERGSLGEFEADGCDNC